MRPRPQGLVSQNPREATAQATSTVHGPFPKVRSPGPPLVALALFALVAAPAAAVYTLSADLEAPPPIRTAGILAPIVSPQNAHEWGILRPSAASWPASRLMNPTKVDVYRLSWMEPLGPAPSPTDDGHTNWNYGLVEATLDLKTLANRPEVYFEGGEPSAFSLASRCDVARSDPDDVQAVPSDPARARQAQQEFFSPGTAQRLRADCDYERADVQARRLVIYGLDVVLSIPGQAPEEIRTGTFDTKDPNGLPVMRRMTQVLWLIGNEYHSPQTEGTFGFSLPGAGQATLYADGFLATGDLGVPDSKGSIAWGAMRERGNVQAFETRGAVQITPSEYTYIGLDGTTTDGPTVPGRRDWFATVPPAAWAVTAALGLAALVWYGLPFFTRLVPDRILDHPRRQQILEFVRGQPGVETNTVARTLGIPWSKAVHHVRILSANGHIRLRRVDGRTALFLTVGLPVAQLERVALLRRESFRRLFELLQERPGLDQAAVCAAVGLSQSRVSKSLRRLALAGLVRQDLGDGRKRYYALPPA